MTTGHVFIATSLDGYIARPDRRLDWLTKQNTKGEDHGYDTFVAAVDGIVMGRGSFQTVLTFDVWPYDKPVIVATTSLSAKDIPEHLAEKVTLSNLEPAGIMARLDQMGWSRAYIDGGKLVQSFIRAGEVADLVLTTIPILIGNGLPLFGPVLQDIDLELVSVKSFPSGLVQSLYRFPPKAVADPE